MLRLHSARLAVCLLPFALVACGDNHASDDPRTQPPLVRSASVIPANETSRAFTGVVVARTQSDLGFRVQGKILERLVDTGQTVKQGQPLMRLDPVDLKLQAQAQQRVIFYHVETLNGPKKIQAEIQIRTMAMNFWATIEHSLQYKYKTNIPPYVKERLANAAQAIIALDGEMSSVRNEIMNAQNSSLIQRNLVMDILQNIENLYQKSNRREVEKIQDEFYRIYASNDLQQLKRFHQQLDIIAEGYCAQAVTSEGWDQNL